MDIRDLMIDRDLSYDDARDVLADYADRDDWLARDQEPLLPEPPPEDGPDFIPVDR